MKYQKVTNHLINVALFCLILNLLFGSWIMLKSEEGIKLVEFAARIVGQISFIIVFFLLKKLVKNVISSHVFTEGNVTLFRWISNTIFLSALAWYFIGLYEPSFKIIAMGFIVITEETVQLGALGGITKILEQIFREAVRVQNEKASLEHRVENLEEENKYII